MSDHQEGRAIAVSAGVPGEAGGSRGAGADADPAVASAEPGTASAEPGTASAEPGTASAEPGTAAREPAVAGTAPPAARRPALREIWWRPLPLLIVAALVTVGLGFAASRLTADASASLLMDTSSPAYHEQAQFAATFGADPVVVLAEPAAGQQLLTPGHLVGLAELEGKLSRLPGVSRVYGPGTLVNTFATVVTQRALALCTAEGQKAQQQAVAVARAKKQPAAAQARAGTQAFNAAVKSCAEGLAAKYPSLSLPALNNPAFYDQLLLESNGSVRPFWRGVLPSSSRALITVRMRPTASLSQVSTVQSTISGALTGPAQRTITSQTGQHAQVPTMAGDLAGLRFTASGTPVLMVSLARSSRDSLRLLLPAALLAMLVVTMLVLRVRHRLLAVAMAVLAGIWTAGAAALLHLPLTPATLVVLPVVLGLATDYMLQTVNRLAEEQGPPEQRFRSASRAILPATGAAAAATAAGVLAFAVSGVPLIRQFGLFLALGVAMSWLSVLVVGLPLLSGLLWRRRAAPPPLPVWTWLARPARWPAPLLVPAILIGLAGWAALPATRVQTNPAGLLPPSSAAVASARSVARQVGYAGELDLVVTGPDVTRTDAVAWMAGMQRRLAGPQLHPVNGLPGFLLSFNYGKPPSQQTAQAILTRLPRYLTQSVVSRDHRIALITFGQAKVTSLAQDTQLIDRIDRVAAHPPAGFRAYPAGLAVIASSALRSLIRAQVLLNLIALAVVFSVLLAAIRRPLLALLSVLPAAVAAGWATGAEYLLGIQATPITILLSGVVVAFATEFSVLWLSRYRAERAAGQEPAAAAGVASGRVGPAIVAAALALIAGFAVLALSQVPMLRDFGLWCAADLAVATVAVLFLLPSLIPRVAR